MLESVLIVARQVGVLFVLIAIGYVCNRTKLLNAPTVKGMTDLVLFTVTPCVIITAFQRKYELSALGGLGLTFVVYAVSCVLCIAAAHSLIRDADEKRRRVLRFAVVFSNCGYMAIPMQKAILGDDGVFYGAVPVALFNILCWTYGLWLMNGDTNNGINGNHGKISRNFNCLKIVLNPGIVGCAIGLALFLARVTLPEIIVKPMRHMADLNTPIPMVIIGYYLAEIKLKSLSKSFNCPNVFRVIHLRLFIMPLILLGLIFATGRVGYANSVAMLAVMIAASAPVAAVTTMFASKFDQDTTLSVELVSFSTVISIISMPLVIGLARYLIYQDCIPPGC
ncbi:MAG: AEC family transporter [Kiritimatiellaeota bacterium]|nr:AEC family transporter [Kiritimatiellota bacterium]